MEEFRIITGFSNYEISNLGNVKNKTTGKIMKQSINVFGYYFVSMTNDKNIKQQCRVHRLIGLTFIPNPNNKPIIDHINNDRKNNNINNLRWASSEENNGNRSLTNKNKSGYIGVHFDKHMKKWRAQITHNKKLIDLGYFNNIEDAVNVRVMKSRELRGVFSNQFEKK